MNDNTLCVLEQYVEWETRALYWSEDLGGFRPHFPVLKKNSSGDLFVEVLNQEDEELTIFDGQDFTSFCWWDNEIHGERLEAEEWIQEVQKEELIPLDAAFAVGVIEIDETHYISEWIEGETLEEAIAMAKAKWPNDVILRIHQDWLEPVAYPDRWDHDEIPF